MKRDGGRVYRVRAEDTRCDEGAESMRVRVGLQTKEREIQREECECVKAVVKRGRGLALKRERLCWRREKEGEFH